MNKYVYVLQVDGSGKQYAGYRMEMSEKIYDELVIDKDWMEQIAITDELVIICNRESAVMGLMAIFNSFAVFGYFYIISFRKRFCSKTLILSLHNRQIPCKTMTQIPFCCFLIRSC